MDRSSEESSSDSNDEKQRAKKQARRERRAEKRARKKARKKAKREAKRARRAARRKQRARRKKKYESSSSDSDTDSSSDDGHGHRPTYAEMTRRKPRRDRHRGQEMVPPGFRFPFFVKRKRPPNKSRKSNTDNLTHRPAMFANMTALGMALHAGTGCFTPFTVAHGITDGVRWRNACFSLAELNKQLGRKALTEDKKQPSDPLKTGKGKGSGAGADSSSLFPAG